jgi:hypothetical protein
MRLIVTGGAAALLIGLLLASRMCDWTSSPHGLLGPEPGRESSPGIQSSVGIDSRPLGRVELGSPSSQKFPPVDGRLPGEPPYLGPYQLPDAIISRYARNWEKLYEEALAEADEVRERLAVAESSLNYQKKVCRAVESAAIFDALQSGRFWCLDLDRMNSDEWAPSMVGVPGYSRSALLIPLTFRGTKYRIIAVLDDQGSGLAEAQEALARLSDIEGLSVIDDFNALPEDMRRRFGSRVSRLYDDSVRVVDVGELPGPAGRFPRSVVFDRDTATVRRSSDPPEGRKGR